MTASSFSGYDLYKIILTWIIGIAVLRPRKFLKNKTKLMEVIWKFCYDTQIKVSLKKRLYKP
ncbi:hypothetical protein D0463_04985 [Bacillus sp. V59.32b]|nr:hypothetical protein D0463_04985 [Bacillus sp. V59.32b]